MGLKKTENEDTIHVRGALRADMEGTYFRPEAYYDAPWIASWIRAKAIPLLEGDLPETVLPLEEETHEEDGVSQTVMSIQGGFSGGTRLTVGTFELPKGAVTLFGARSPSYASVCAIVKPGSGDGDADSRRRGCISEAMGEPRGAKSGFGHCR